MRRSRLRGGDGDGIGRGIGGGKGVALLFGEIKSGKVTRRSDRMGWDGMGYKGLCVRYPLFGDFILLVVTLYLRFLAK